MANGFRCVVEVLKWMEPKSVLAQAESVSSLWTAACHSEELWQDFLELAEGTAEEVSEAPPTLRLLYKAVCQERLKPLVALLLNTSLNVFDCDSQTFIRKLSFAEQSFTNEHAAALIHNKRILVCGGIGSTNLSILVSMRTGAVEEIEKMRQDRAFHGAVRARKSVYVFGGYMNRLSLRSAERFDLSLQAWVELPAMLTCHSSFTPIAIESRIYLCGGNTRNSEFFDMDSQRYRALPFRFDQSSWTLAFYYNEDLFCFEQAAKYRLRAGGWERTQGPTTMGM